MIKALSLTFLLLSFGLLSGCAQLNSSAAGATQDTLNQVISSSANSVGDDLNG